LTDVWQFLIGATGDHMNLGNWRFLWAAIFIALLVASGYIAVLDWREDPEQRTGKHLGTWGARVLIGCMWFQSMLWKLPLPVSGGLQYWTEKQMGTRAAFAFHREFVLNVLVPNLYWLGTLVFLSELMFAVSLILGLGVRVAAALGVLFVLHLWLGIYIPADPAEWPWSYIFLATLMFLFALHAAGRSLGLDAWLRRHVPAVRDSTGLLGKLLNIAG